MASEAPVRTAEAFARIHASMARTDVVLARIAAGNAERQRRIDALERYVGAASGIPK